MTFTLRELAEALDATLHGEDVAVTGVAFIDAAGSGDLVFVESRSWLEKAERSQAAALIVPATLVPKGKPYLVVESPRVAFLRVLGLFQGEEQAKPGIHPTAVVPDSCSVDPSATLLPLVALGEGCAIGPRTVIHPHVSLGQNVRIGADCILYPNVSVYSGVVVGDRVIVHANTVLGSDGFGYETVEGQHLKVPHLGNVVIEDDVEIGANCSVDRAKTGSTVIGRGTKIDNLVQIAHNVRIGRHCLLAGRSGLAGSATLGDRAILAADAGGGPHSRIGEGAVVLARGSVVKEVRPGEVVSGFPARDHKTQLKLQAAINQLPELLQSVKELRRKVAEMESRGGERTVADDD